MSTTKNIDEPRVAPHLRVEVRGTNNVSHAAYVNNGEQILWVNLNDRSCVIEFPAQSPFAGQEKTHLIAAGCHKLSPPIQGTINTQYPYKARCEDRDDDDDDKGDPVIVIKG